MTNPILLLIVGPITGWIVLVNLFSAVMHAKAIIARGERIHWSFKAPLYVGGLVGVLLDIAFNLTVGCYIYRGEGRLLEVPIRRWLRGELTFSARTQYHVDHSSVSSAAYARAVWWGLQLNKFDPKHINGV